MSSTSFLFSPARFSTKSALNLDLVSIPVAPF